LKKDYWNLDREHGLMMFIKNTSQVDASYCILKALFGLIKAIFT